MSSIGVLIETRNNEIKKGNFGIITAASSHGKDSVHALIFGDSSEYKKEILEKDGIKKIIEISSDKTDFNKSPDLKAQALTDTMKEFDIKANLDTGSGRIYGQRIGSGKVSLHLNREQILFRYLLL